MNRSRGRIVTFPVAVLGACVVVACGVVFKDRLADEHRRGKRLVSWNAGMQ